MSRWTKEYKEKFGKAVELYNENISTNNISEILKMDRCILRKNLKDQGFELENHNVDKDILSYKFKSIKTEEQAYWLGFMYADGYVSKDSNRVELCLKDKEHIEKFSYFLGIKTNRMKIREIEGKEYYRISFRNKELHDDLINNGCIPQKSLKLTFPNEKIIEESLINCFVRGYFDGDGSIGLYSRDGITYHPQFSLNGTKEFLDKIKDIYCLPNNKYSMDGKSYNYGTTAYIATKIFLNSLYKNANVYLDRKYNIYLKCRFD